MEIETKIKLLSQMDAFGIKKLVKVGDSFALIVPKPWVVMFCTEIENNYYFQLQVENNQLIFSPINTEEVDTINVKRRRKT